MSIATASAVLFLIQLAPWSVAATNPRAKTPEQLVSDLLAAAHAGDTEAFLSLLTASSRDTLTQNLANQATVQGAYETFLQALNSRFGAGTTVLSDPPDDLKTAIGRLLETQVLSQKPGANGAVELRVKTTFKTPSGQTANREETLLVRLEAGGWKLAGGFPDDSATATAELAAAAQITQQVRDGKYQDRQDAMIALSNAWAGRASK